MGSNWEAYLLVNHPDLYREYREELYTIRINPMPTRTRRVMVVQFDVTKRNIPTHPKKTVFFEYFCLERGAYLYFEPVRG